MLGKGRKNPQKRVKEDMKSEQHYKMLLINNYIL